MDANERARLRKYQATPTDATEEQRKLTGPNSAVSLTTLHRAPRPRR